MLPLQVLIFYGNIRLHDYAIQQLEQQIKEIQIQDKIQAPKGSINYNEKLKSIEKPYFTGRLKIIVLKSLACRKHEKLTLYPPLRPLGHNSKSLRSVH